MPAKPFDVVLFGATGFVGRQAAVALLHRAATQPLRWAVAGRSSDKLHQMVAQLVPVAAEQPGVLVADANQLDSLQTMAAQAQVVLNLAGPYAMTGEAVVQACIANGTHHLDLSGETFWVQQLVNRHHVAAVAAQVKVIPSCGYEALPFDLATLWAAQQLHDRTGEACRDVKIVVNFVGQRIKSVHDAVSGGTIASLKSLLAYDNTDCVRNPACLLPPGTPDAAEVAQRNAYRFAPRYDEDVEAVVAPTIPAPFVNPPTILRSRALLAASGLFSNDFRYSEAMNMKSLVPSVSFLPPSSTLPLQWAAAASLAAPLANLSAALAGPLKFERTALRGLVDWIAPKPGEGPSEDVLAHTGYSLDVFAVSVNGKKLRGRVDAQGHPGYRSTPEMAVTAAVGLAKGTLGRTPHFGVVTPATGLGLAAVGAMRDAGLVFSVVA
ncbi:MAG TPA: saccharopine dehydrogenase NADP-binding domain-containing protein [Albitalea sp.]|nr:saccharopine dehydrogenase NADP-binding domain-containing protein [Albitalea sp.]